MLIDSHAHIYDEAFDEDREQMMQRAREAGLVHIVMPSISREEYPRLTSVLEQYPQETSAALGLHPAYVKEDYRDELAFIQEKIDEYPWVAIGEIGLDYYWSTDFKAEQLEALRFQLDLALSRDLPVIFHVRNAFEDLLKILNVPAYRELRGIIHSFTGTQEELEAVLSLPNMLVGINGVSTFKNSNLRDYIAMIPLQRLVLETDAPYLAPVPMRGKRNEPAFIRHTAGHIASLWGLTLDELSEVTSRNTAKLFGITL